jgi:hypothetical protein
MPARTIHIRDELEQTMRRLQDLLNPMDPAHPIDPLDPLGIENDCVNPMGHRPIADCGEVVCQECGRVFWQ